MKNLRNPLVLAVLGLVALLLAGGVYWFLLRTPKKPRKTISAATGPLTTHAATNALAAGRLWPDLPIDIDTVTSNLPLWQAEPQRDPFQFTEVLVLDTAQPTNSPLYLMKLQAIWRQTDGRAAVINGRVVMEGDTFEGMLVERIEADRVWFKGPERTEALVFGQVRLPPPPPADPRKGLRGIFGPEVTPPPKTTKPKP